MYEKIKTYVRQHQMILESDVVIAGVSGGPDSVCLLDVLERLRQELGFLLAAVHVNHGLRGPEADRDEQFVRELCHTKGIPLLAVRRDVADYACRHGMSAEEAGREVRREAYRQAMKEYGGTKIALAHHMDDNAETLLLNLARGTGISGMAGIRPVAGEYIRPLLGVRRGEIEEYLEKEKAAYCIDRTNYEDTYTRNRIRNHILPYLEQEVNGQAVRHMQEFAEQMEVFQGYVERQVCRLWGECVTVTGHTYEIDLEGFERADVAIRPCLIHDVLGKAAGRKKDIGAVHIRQVEALSEKQPGKEAVLPYGLHAVRGYGKLCIFREDGPEGRGKPLEKEEMFLCGSGGPDIDRACGNVRIRVFGAEEIEGAIMDLPYTKWFDYDIIQNDVVLRYRRPGDYLDIDRQGHRQKLKNYFINEKIPKEQREKVALIAEGSQILWVVGCRQNQRYQVTGDTKRILEIGFAREYKGEDYGREDSGISARGRGAEKNL